MGMSNQIPSSRLVQPGVCTSMTRPASPFEGQAIFETDTDRMLIWNGTAWVIPNAPAQNPMGLELIAMFTANGTNRALVCDNIFTSTYDNYRVVLRLNSTIQENACFYQYIDTNGNTVSTGYYGTAYGQDFTTGSTTFVGTLTATTVQYIGYLPNSGGAPAMLNATFDIYSPNLSTVHTTMNGLQTGIRSGAYYHGGAIFGQMINNIAHRGFRIDNGGAGNLTGVVSVYGYRK